MSRMPNSLIKSQPVSAFQAALHGIQQSEAMLAVSAFCWPDRQQHARCSCVLLEVEVVS